MLKKLIVCALCLCTAACIDDATRERQRLHSKIVMCRARILTNLKIIRDMEKEVREDDGPLKERLDALEKELGELYVAANPKLEKLYKEQLELEEELKKLNEERDAIRIRRYSWGLW